MARPNTSPLIRTQACVCGERHPVKVVLVGVPVVDCVYAAGPGLQLDQTEGFPKTWYLRMRPDEVVEIAPTVETHADVQAAQERVNRREERMRNRNRKNPDSAERK